MRLKQLEVTLEQRDKVLEEKQSLLELEEMRKSSTSGMDSKAVYAVRAAEEKSRKLEVDLEEKVERYGCLSFHFN